MIGLMFLGAALLWLVLVVFLALKIPKWLGLKRTGWMLSLVLLVIGSIGPFVDHWVGMKQFERLCANARTSIQVSPDIGKVMRAKTNLPKYIDLPGYFVNIQMVRSEYIDIDTNRPFLSYETYFTPGGKVGGLVMLGSNYSCDVTAIDEYRSLWKKYSIQQLMDEGYKK